MFSVDIRFMSNTCERSSHLFIYLFKILKTFSKMLHTNLIGCRGKTKRDAKYNISTLKGKEAAKL